MCFANFYYIILIICLVLIPIIELYYSLIDKNVIVCNLSIYIDIPSWLLTNSTASLFLVFITYRYLVDEYITIFKRSKDTSVKCCKCKCKCCKVIFIFCNIILLLWNIIGTYILWKDCNNMTPDAIYKLMWVSLIAGYISFANNMLILHNDWVKRVLEFLPDEKDEKYESLFVVSSSIDF